MLSRKVAFPQKLAGDFWRSVKFANGLEARIRPATQRVIRALAVLSGRPLEDASERRVRCNGLRPAESPVDENRLKGELASIGAEHGADSSAARKAVLDLLKEVLANGRGLVRQRLEQDGEGERCASSSPRSPIRSSRRCLTIATTHVFPASNPSAAEQLSLVAVGGYGRGTLAPHSDIDLLFLFPWKQTAWSESVTEYILYMLWDLRLKVGHATRTVNEDAEGGARGHDRPHRAARGASDRRRRAAFSRAADALPERGRGRHGARVHRRQAGRARCAARPRRPVALPRRAERQGRKRRPARPADALLDCQVLLPRRAPTRRSSMPGCLSRQEYSQFLRCSDFLWAVRCQSALPHRPGGGAALLRPAAGARAPARLPEASRACMRPSGS